ncbi:hypothetical protein L6R50_24150 [Myxococcota bacterium]|nr:hypothetical protein [Myxococcota bacterium]
MDGFLNALALTTGAAWLGGEAGLLAVGLPLASARREQRSTWEEAARRVYVAVVLPAAIASVWATVALAVGSSAPSGAAFRPEHVGALGVALVCTWMQGPALNRVRLCADLAGPERLAVARRLSAWTALAIAALACLVTVIAGHR